MTDFTMEKGADGVAVITWDVKDKSMNVLSREAFGADRRHDRATALADDAVKGVVINPRVKGHVRGRARDLRHAGHIRAEAGD